MVGREGQDPEIATIFRLRRQTKNQNESGNPRSAVGHVRRIAGALLVIFFSLSFTDSPFRLLCQKVGSM